MTESLHHVPVCLAVTCVMVIHMLVSVRQLTAKQRVGHITAFLPHSHTNTPGSHSCVLIGIPPCASELSSKVLHLAGHCSCSAVWRIDLPCCCNYQSPDSVWGTLLEIKWRLCFPKWLLFHQMSCTLFKCSPVYSCVHLYHARSIDGFHNVFSSLCEWHWFSVLCCVIVVHKAYWSIQ